VAEFDLSGAYTALNVARVANSVNSDDRRWIDLRDLRARLHIKLLCAGDKCENEYRRNDRE